MKAEVGETDDDRNALRTVRIAELLFNQQSVDGIDGRLADLQAGKIEATYAELEAASFLLRRGVPFKYVDETYVRGLDYDGQVLLSSGQPVNCEMKCKIESTELSEGTIRNALDAARKQLPAVEPGLVFLKISEPWIRNPAITQLLPTAISNFLRGTARVVAVILQWEQVHSQLGKDSISVILYKYRVERGTPAKSVAPEVGALLTQLSEPGTVAWVSFHSIAAEAVLNVPQ
jgi:hypothetical protein